MAYRLSLQRRQLHLEYLLHDEPAVQCQHQAEKRLADAGLRDVRDDWQIDGGEHRLPRPVVDHLVAKQHLLVALCNDA